MYRWVVTPLTTQDILHIDGGVLFPESFPSTHNSGSGIDQGTVHVEEATQELADFAWRHNGVHRIDEKCSCWHVRRRCDGGTTVAERVCRAPGTLQSENIGLHLDFTPEFPDRLQALFSPEAGAKYPPVRTETDIS